MDYVNDLLLLLKRSAMHAHESCLEVVKNREQTDAELISEYRLSNRESAFTVLYIRHKLKMQAYIYTIVHDNHDTEDVLHNAWEKVLIAFKHDHYEESQDFEKWFKSICYREAGLWKRAKKRFLHGDEYIPDKPDNALSAEERLINEETEARLTKMLDGLSQTARQIVKLHVLEDKSFPQVSKILSKKENIIRALYSRAMKKLEQQTCDGHI